MPTNNTEKNCECKEMTCPKDCDKNHTHHGYFCEVCEPEACKKMYPTPKEKTEWKDGLPTIKTNSAHIKVNPVSEEAPKECRGKCHSLNEPCTECSSTPTTDWEEKERKAFKKKRSQILKEVYEWLDIDIQCREIRKAINESTDYWLSRLATARREGYEEGFNNGYKSANFEEYGGKTAEQIRTEERERIKGIVNSHKAIGENPYSEGYNDAMKDIIRNLDTK